MSTKTEEIKEEIKEQPKKEKAPKEEKKDTKKKKKTYTVDELLSQNERMELFDEYGRRKKIKVKVKEGKLKKSALTDSVIYKGDDNKYYEQVNKKCLDITEQIPFEIPENWVCKCT